MKKSFAIGLVYLIALLLPYSTWAFELNGFADVSFTKSTERAKNFRNGDFAVGSLDLYFARTMEDVDILMELVIEKGATVDLERLHIGYTFSDAMRLHVGRFHTPLGFWNTAYHHGVQLQPTILRPELLNFEDERGILPTHTVGIHIFGRQRTLLGKIEYGGFIGNGSRIKSMTDSKGNKIKVLSPNVTEDTDAGKSIGIYGTVSPVNIPGLKVGISFHKARVQSDSTVAPHIDVDQTIWGLAATYVIRNVGISGEFFTFRDEDKKNNKRDNNAAYYGLITYTYKDRWIPYIMYENMNRDNDDPYFGTKALDTEDTIKTTTGIRYNITYRSSLKGEVRVVKKDGQRWDEYAIQWALAF